MQDGWIKLHRKFRDWEWHQDPNMVSLFIYLLLEANHEQNRWKGIVVERGQVVFGRKKASLHTGISERSIRTCIERLKSTNELTIKSTNKYSIITLCNYNKYQTSKIEIDQQNDQQTDIQTTSNRPATDHKQEVKNIRKKERTYSEFSLPSDIEPKTWEAFLEMRKAMKKPLTEYGKSLILKKLNDIPQDKNKVLEQSISHNWIGVFELKDTNGTKPALAPTPIRPTTRRDEEQWEEQLKRGEL